jgi:hypothetical protein
MAIAPRRGWRAAPGRPAGPRWDRGG